MNRENTHIDELIVKYLLGEAGAEEGMQLKEWRAADSQNEQYFTHFKLIWEESKAIESKSQIDENEAWERMKPRMNNLKKEKAASKRIALSWKATLRVAAILLLSIGAYFVYDRQMNKLIVVQSSGSTTIETLPDGSVVTLNKNASITYPRRFSGNSRKVSLSGEAFFNITPNKLKPFIIAANGISIRVVGTSFNVKTDAGKTEVVVETGIVEVSKLEHSVRLSPKEKAVVTTENDAPVKDVSKDVLYNYYRTNEFVCDNTPLWRLVEVLNEAYNTKIVIANPALRDAPLKVTFKNESLDFVLSVVAETLELSVERNGTEILLK